MIDKAVNKFAHYLRSAFMVVEQSKLWEDKWIPSNLASTHDQVLHH